MRNKPSKRIVSFAVMILVLLLSPGGAEVFAATKKPEISAEGAILIDADTGEILYEKNADKRYYPASITKIMTALLVIENANFDDMVEFSSKATENLESGAVTLGLSAGDKVNVKDCLYALMLRSANDVANGLAENTGGSIEGFANMMNKRAKELGCTDSNFVNPNGLNSNSHYTTAKDMALIAKACFKNEVFKDIVATGTYTFPAVKNNPNPVLLTMGHKMIFSGDYRYYKGVIGGKTGYTRKAGNTLVTGAQKDGVNLIVVILKSTGTHYSDTKKLLDYGFSVQTKEKKENTAQDVEESSKKDTMIAGEEKKETLVKDTDKREEKNPSTESKVKDAPPADSNAALTGPGERRKSGWILDVKGWYYIKDNQARAKSEVLEIKSKKYWFDSDAYMAVGWRKDNNGNWYYMNEDGSMRLSSWVLYKDLWYYLGENGAMLTDTRTPDGFIVDAQGVWVP